MSEILTLSISPISGPVFLMQGSDLLSFSKEDTMAGKTTTKKTPAKKPEAATTGQLESDRRRIRDLEERMTNVENAVTSSLGLSITPPAPTEPDPED